MERRFVLFLVLSFAMIIGHTALMRHLNPPKPQPRAKAPPDAKPGAKDGGGKEGPQKEPEDDEKKPERPEEEPEQPEEEPGEAPGEAAAAKVDDSEFKRAPGLVTLGSLDPEGPYRFAATLTTKGAAVARIALSDPRYRNLEDGSGYLGHLAAGGGKVGQDDRGPGCLVQAVVPGTPAAKAGLEVGDLITVLDKEPITKAKDLEVALAKTKPNDTISLTVVRVGKKRGELSVTLGHRPLEVVKPEGKDRLSFLLTLHQFDDQRLTRDDQKPLVDVGRELKGLDLWDGYWSLVRFDTKEEKWKEVDVSELRKTKPTEISFQRTIKHLRITKTFRIANVPEDSPKDANYRAYHLEFDVRIQNIGVAAQNVAYQLDGPTGLPVEGAWYASKIARGQHWYNLFARAGLRDVAVSKISEGHRSFDLIGCPTIADDAFGAPGENQSVGFIGVDAKYFAAVLIPQGQGKDKRWAAAPMDVAQWQPLRVGEVNKKRKATLTDTSCRLVSQAYPLAPGETLSHRFVIFAGPKTPDVLANYGLGELIYYGWFSALARPMSHILHFFHRIVPNYGLAILMLTVLVRGCMFPLSRKQALGARKMQELQPEIKRIQEKYKNDMEGRTKAQQELFRKHNYNPLSGCLVLFVQLPIFVALYRSLMVDIELRGAPLLWEGIRWCSNLSAPDMLFYWEDFMPGLVVGYLGPYFNILPILTIALFILQQKMFMPPATDEKSAMQQKMMKYMMVFMGVLFFKVASGLCIYFIASSLWGLAERKFLPKASPAEPHAKPATRADAKARDKPRDKPQPKPTPQQALSGRDGTAARKKKKTKRGKR